MGSLSQPAHRLAAAGLVRRSRRYIEIVAQQSLASLVFALACSDTGNTTSGADAGTDSGDQPPMGGRSTGGVAGAQAQSGNGGSSTGAGGVAASSAGMGLGGAMAGGTAGSTLDGSAASSGGAAGGGGAADDLCDVGVWDGSTPEVLQLTGNTFAHDPTMIEVGGIYYRFWTGDYVPAATSTNLTYWVSAPSVYGSTYPSWVNEWLMGIPGETFNFPWAPDVSFFNGRVHLYSSFSGRFGDNISCITHLSTMDIAAGDWTDHGPVICTSGNERYNAIDADVAIDEAGTAWLAFGSFWDGIMAFELNADGSRAGGDLTRLAWANEIEAPVLFRRCGYYYLFVTWGLCCPGEGRTIDQLTYRVAVGRSQSILGPYVDRDGIPMLEGGGTLVVGGDGVTWAAAGHSDVIVTGDTIYHLYHAYRQSNGAAELRIVEMPFDEEGWPVAGGP